VINESVSIAGSVRLAAALHGSPDFVELDGGAALRRARLSRPTTLIDVDVRRSPGSR